MAYDEVDISHNRACLGRIFFHIPDGITLRPALAQREFAKSVVRVPFRILTKEKKSSSQDYKSIREQVQDAFKKK